MSKFLDEYLSKFQDLPEVNMSENKSSDIQKLFQPQDEEMFTNTSPDDLKLLVYDMKNFVRNKYPNLLISDIGKVNFEFCLKYPGYRKSYGSNNCLWLMKKLNESGWA